MKEIGYVPPVVKRIPVGGEIWVTKDGTYIYIVQITRDSENQLIPEYFGYMLVNNSIHSPYLTVGYDMVREAKQDRLFFVARTIKDFKAMNLDIPIR